MSKVVATRRQEVLRALKRLSKGKTPAHYKDVHGKMREDFRDRCDAKDAQRDLLQMLKEGLGKLDDKGTVKQPRPGAYSYQPPEPEKAKHAFAAYGIGWKKDKVKWDWPRGRRSPNSERLPGTNAKFSEKAPGKVVDFEKQAGIYLLHQGAQTVYVGRTKGAPGNSSDFMGLYRRLKYHQENKHKWDAFSWFGFLKLNADGSHAKDEYVPEMGESFDLLQLITIIEAVVIDGIGTRDNKKGGDIGDVPRFEQFCFPEQYDERKEKLGHPPQPMK